LLSASQSIILRTVFCIEGRRVHTAIPCKKAAILSGDERMRTLADLAATLSGGTASRPLVDECLSRIANPEGEGSRVFLKVHDKQARAAADFHDAMRGNGAQVSRFAGIPVSIKDLFDMAGDVTTAGSAALRDSEPATRDAPVVARLRAAGFIPVGRTNMTEFAFSGLGINPHYGTPLNPYDRAAGRIPGGSSSGAAVSVTDGMAYAALGTDTGGSCRIPAALCGLVGFKPTARRVPLAGAVPLSTSLDSIGPIAASVQCCATIDAVLAGEEPYELQPMPLSGLRLAVPQSYVFEGIEKEVGQAFERTLTAFGEAGVQISELPLRELSELPGINTKGGFAAPEGYVYHRRLIETKGGLYDPRILTRILRGREQDAADYIALQQARADFIARMDKITAPYDALIMPTVPLTAPRIEDLASEENYNRINLLLLRNPAIANFLDRCAISIPCHLAGDAPVGAMLIGASGADHRLLALAASLASLLCGRANAG
jgi:aspartyl-tRNA(Asn)/glutamyl-tRNA(Gln) amidotransferase subunit A